MKIKTISLLLFFTILISILSLSASAETEGIFEYFDESDYGYCMIGKCYEPVGKVVIPTEIGGNPVVTIHDSAFADANELTAIVIPKTITGIYATSFRGCTGLKDVYYEGSASEWNEIQIGFECEIDEGIKDTSLFDAKIHFNDETTTKKHGIFEYVIENKKAIIIKCERNTKGVVKVPEKIEGCDVISIGNHAFFNCTEIEEIILPDTVEKISTFAFAYCDNLKKVNIPKKVSELKPFTFVDCVSLKAVSLPDKIKEIPMGLFMRSGIENIVIPSSVETISYKAVIDCESLTSVTLPQNLKLLSEGAFTNTAIKELVFSEGLKEIEAWAITECKNLEMISLPKSVEKIGMNICDGCDNLKTVRYPGNESDWEKIDLVKINDEINNAEKIFSYKAPENKKTKTSFYIAISSAVILALLRIIISAVKKKRNKEDIG
ncbi:MAG: leucine-rich repeat domain-containing protein [Clostridia bacterium]|nr:leucine-rich repeat domain-containing protein [Clostridia bacterium]